MWKCTGLKYPAVAGPEMSVGLINCGLPQYTQISRRCYSSHKYIVPIKMKNYFICTNKDSNKLFNLKHQTFKGLTKYIIHMR